MLINQIVINQNKFLIKVIISLDTIITASYYMLDGFEKYAIPHVPKKEYFKSIFGNIFMREPLRKLVIYTFYEGILAFVKNGFDSTFKLGINFKSHIITCLCMEVD